MHTISHRVAGFLERQGILERDEENSYLNLEGEEDPMQQVLVCSVSYRIAIGHQQERKVFTLQTLPSWEENDRFAQVAKKSGFQLSKAMARLKLERLSYFGPTVNTKTECSKSDTGNLQSGIRKGTTQADL